MLTKYEMTPLTGQRSKGDNASYEGNAIPTHFVNSHSSNGPVLISVENSRSTLKKSGAPKFGNGVKFNENPDHG